MATENDGSVFASAWDDSDIVLVVEEQDLHVHKWVLKSQSPVFKAMFDGHFKEASQDKITLEKKVFKSMVQFLKLLYPWSMFEDALIALNNDESRLSVMALAEEYQCVNVIKRCIDEAEITPENVLDVLPYAVKYHQTALPKMYDIINWSAPTSKLEEVLSTLESKETSINLLLTKCRFLESGIVEMQDALTSMICDILDIKSMSNQVGKTKSSSGFFSGSNTNAPRTTIVNSSRCPHRIDVKQINTTKVCVHCKETYKEKFISPIPSCNDTQNFFDVLQRGNDIATAVKETVP